MRVSVAFPVLGDFLKAKDVKRLDEAIIATALLLDKKNVPFNVANLFEESKYSKQL